MLPLFKTEILIDHLRANLDEKILFCKITHHLELEIRKMPVKGMVWEQDFYIQFWSVIYLLLKLKLYY